ncbi:MAG: hypothetical protein Q4Q62_06935 [Thermoplasmata archaeon]|nr:hypothetical protein [Thermoplasmata archaeon]
MSGEPPAPMLRKPSVIPPYMLTSASHRALPRDIPAFVRETYVELPSLLISTMPFSSRISSFLAIRGLVEVCL